jgi:hypothetical protein
MDDPSAYYVWEVPGKPVRVCLSHTAMDRVLNEAMRGLGLLPRRGAEVGGLLLGTVEPGEVPTTRIEDAVPVPIEYAFGPFYAFSENDKNDFRETMRQWERSADRPLHAVGFYRSHMQDQLALGQHDLWLFSNYFPDPSHVALLIRPRAMRSSLAGFFIREQGQIRAESSYLEFPMRPQGRPARTTSPPAPEPAPSPAPVSEPAREETRVEAPADIPLPSFLNVPPPEEKKKRNWKWWKRAGKDGPSVEPGEIEQRPIRPLQPFWTSWWLQVPILGCLLLVDGLLGFVSARQFRSPPARPAAALRDPYALSLMVVEYGDNLCLTWDRNAPAIAQAQRALLSISDGDQNQSLDMELPILQSQGFGVTYHRVTDRVKFRLEVFLKSGRSVSETWVLGASAASPPLETPRPVR